MRRLTNKEFIEKAKYIYNDMFDYSLVIYESSKKEVIIICNKCGLKFNQTPNVHLQGKRKPNCKCSNKLNTNKFIERAMKINKNVYDYNNVNYIDSYTKVKIFCKKCKSFFWQLPHNHLNGQNCTYCYKKNRKTTEEFILQSMKIHGDKRYTYSNSNYINSNTKVEIICNICNSKFLQIPTDHLHGSGCPCCGGGFNPNLPAILYYIKIFKDNISLYKIGITNRTVKQRFNSEMKYIKMIKFKEYVIGIDAYYKEQEILERYREYRYEGINILRSGNKEIFTIDILTLDKSLF